MEAGAALATAAPGNATNKNDPSAYGDRAEAVFAYVWHSPDVHIIPKNCYLFPALSLAGNFSCLTSAPFYRADAYFARYHAGADLLPEKCSCCNSVVFTIEQTRLGRGF